MLRLRPCPRQHSPSKAVEQSLPARGGSAADARGAGRLAGLVGSHPCADAPSAVWLCANGASVLAAWSQSSATCLFRRWGTAASVDTTDFDKAASADAPANNQAASSDTAASTTRAWCAASAAAASGIHGGAARQGLALHSASSTKDDPFGSAAAARGEACRARLSTSPAAEGATRSDVRRTSNLLVRQCTAPGSLLLLQVWQDARGGTLLLVV